MGKNNWLIPVAVIGGALLLTQQSKQEGDGISPVNVFTSGGDSGGGIGDIGGFLDSLVSAFTPKGVDGGGLLPDTGGIVDKFQKVIDDLINQMNINTKETGGIIDNLQEQINNLVGNIGNADPAGILDLGGRNGGDGGGSATPTPNYSPLDILDTIIRTPERLVNTLGENAMPIATGAAILGGTVIASKVLAPVAPIAGQVIGQGVKAVAAPATRVIGTVATGVGTGLTAPVSLSIGSVLGVPAAGAAGYFVGTQFNKTKTGQTLLLKSEEMGTGFRRAFDRVGHGSTMPLTTYAKSVKVPSNFLEMSIQQREAWFKANKR